MGAGPEGDLFGSLGRMLAGELGSAGPIVDTALQVAAPVLAEVQPVVQPVVDTASSVLRMVESGPAAVAGAVLAGVGGSGMSGGPLDWMGNLGAGGAGGGGGEGPGQDAAAKGGAGPEAGAEEEAPAPTTEEETPTTDSDAPADGDGTADAAPADGAAAPAGGGGGAPADAAAAPSAPAGGGGGGAASAPGAPAGMPAGGGGGAPRAAGGGGAPLRSGGRAGGAGARLPSRPAPVVADPAPALSSARGPAAAPIGGGGGASALRPQGGSLAAGPASEAGVEGESRLNEQVRLNIPAPTELSDLEIPTPEISIDRSVPASAGVADGLFSEASEAPLLSETPVWSGAGPAGEGVVGRASGVDIDAIGSAEVSVDISGGGVLPSNNAPSGGDTGAVAEMAGAGQLNSATTQAPITQAPPELGTLDTSGFTAAPAAGVAPAGAPVSALPTAAPLQVRAPNYQAGSENLPSVQGHATPAPSVAGDQAAAAQTLDQEAAGLAPVPGDREAQIAGEVAPQEAEGQAQLQGPTQQGTTDAAAAVTEGTAILTDGQTGLGTAQGELSTAVAQAQAAGAAALQQAGVEPMPSGLSGGTAALVTAPLAQAQAELLSSALPGTAAPIQAPPGATAAMQDADAALQATVDGRVDPTPQFDELVGARLPEPGFTPPTFEEAVETAPPTLDMSLPAPTAAGGSGRLSGQLEGAAAMAAIESALTAQTAAEVGEWQQAAAERFEGDALAAHTDAVADIGAGYAVTEGDAQGALDSYAVSRPDVEPAEQQAAAQAAVDQAVADAAGAQAQLGADFAGAQGTYDTTSQAAAADHSAAVSAARGAHEAAVQDATGTYGAAYTDAQGTYNAGHGAALGTLQGQQAAAQAGAQAAWTAEQQAYSTAMSSQQGSFDAQRAAMEQQSAQAQAQAQGQITADTARFQQQAQAEVQAQTAAAQAQVDAEVASGNSRVDAALQEGVTGFDQEMAAGVSQAEGTRNTANAEIASRRAEAQEERGVLDRIGDAISSAWNAFCSWVSDKLASVRDTINGILEAAKNAALALLEAARRTALSILDTVRSAVHSIISAVAERLRGLIAAIADALRAAISAAVQFLTAAIQAIATALTGLIEAFRTMVNLLVEGLIVAVSLIDADLGAKLQEAADGFLDTFNSLCDTAQASVEQAADSLTATVQAAGDALHTAVTAAEQGLLAAVDSAESALHAATEAAFDAATTAVNAAFDLAAAAVTAAFDLAAAAVTAWFNAQIALVEAAREWVDQHIQQAFAALQAAANWLGERWEDLKAFAEQALVWVEQGLVAFWNSPWRDIVLGALLSAVAIGVIAATGGLALPLVIGITAAVTGATAAAVYGGGELAARRANIDLVTNHGIQTAPGRTIVDPVTGQVVPDPTDPRNDWYVDTLGSFEREPDGSLVFDGPDGSPVRVVANQGGGWTFMGPDGRPVTVSSTDDPAFQDMLRSGFARGADGQSLSGESMGESLNDSAALAASKGAEWAINGAVMAASAGMGDKLIQGSRVARFAGQAAIEGTLDTVGGLVADPLAYAIEDSIDSDQRGFGDSMGEWAENRTHTRDEVKDASGNVIGTQRGRELSVGEIATQEAATLGVNIVTAGLGNAADGITENREFRSQATRVLAENVIGTAEGATSESLTYLTDVASGREQNFSWEQLGNRALMGGASSTIQRTASYGTTAVGNRIAGTPAPHTDAPATESDTPTQAPAEGDTSHTPSTETTPRPDAEVRTDVEADVGETTLTLPVSAPDQDAAQVAVDTAVAQTPTLEQTPLQQQIEAVTGVDKGGDYDAVMSDMRAFYAQLEAEAQASHRTVSGTEQDGPYGWNTGYDVTEVNGRTHVTVKVHLDGDANNISPADLARLRESTASGVDQHYNYQHNLSGADGQDSRLHVEVVFVDSAADAHLSVTVHPGEGRSNLSNWHVNDDPTVAAHELGHQLGLHDEYADANSPGRQVHEDGSLMGNFWTTDPQTGLPVPAPDTGLRQRHLDALQGDIDASRPAQDAPTQDATSPTLDAQQPEVPTTQRTPPPALQQQGDDIIAHLDTLAQSTTDPKLRTGYDAAAEKVRQILGEQAAGISDDLKGSFLSELQTRLADPSNAGKDAFTIIRDIVNDASVKDTNGQVVSNPYLRQGDAIPLDALQGAGNMSRLYGTEKVFGMLTPQAQADLAAIGVDKGSFGAFLAANPDYDLRGSLDSSAFVEGYNNVAWWGLQSEGSASNITELIDALALNPEYYPQGGVRFNVSPETAHGAGMVKPTAFDGMFPEWVPTDTHNPFGVTGGGKQEGVAPRIEMGDVTDIEVFAGVPAQLSPPAPGLLPSAPDKNQANNAQSPQTPTPNQVQQNVTNMKDLPITPERATMASANLTQAQAAEQMWHHTTSVVQDFARDRQRWIEESGSREQKTALQQQAQDIQTRIQQETLGGESLESLYQQRAALFSSGQRAEGVAVQRKISAYEAALRADAQLQDIQKQIRDITESTLHSPPGVGASVYEAAYNPKTGELVVVKSGDQAAENLTLPAQSLDTTTPGKCGMPRAVDTLIRAAQVRGETIAAKDLYTIHGGLRVEEVDGRVVVSHVTACGNCRNIGAVNGITSTGSHPYPIAPNHGPNLATPMLSEDLDRLILKP